MLGKFDRQAQKNLLVTFKTTTFVSKSMEYACQEVALFFAVGNGTVFPRRKRLTILTFVDLLTIESKALTGHLRAYKLLTDAMAKEPQERPSPVNLQNMKTFLWWKQSSAQLRKLLNC